VTRRAHDLDALLGAVRARMLHVPQELHIGWAPPAEIPNLWAEWRHYSHRVPQHHGHWIGISDELRVAPRYVIYYLIWHECAHAALPPIGRSAHHKAWRIVDALCPQRDRACAWLDAHSSPGG
jgi:hypothetical protein